MNPRPRSCKMAELGCEGNYLPFNTLQKCCANPRCAIKAAKSERQKQERREIRAARERIKTRSQWAKEAQQAFNAWIRERDREDPCISCGRYHQGQMHAGHYRTTQAAPELRFDPLNVHAQCAPCNSHLSGNLIEYRIGLERKIGADGLAYLEGPHEPKKYTIDELRAIRDMYRQLARDLKKRRGE